MPSVNNQTEKEFRDRQEVFGHIHESTDLISWVSDVYQEGSTKEKRYRRVIEEFLGGVDTSLNVLEIAAGVGDFVMFCSKLFPQHKYSANDLSELLLKKNIKTVADYFDVASLPTLSFCPVEELIYPNNSFDIIFIKGSVHHFENPTRGFSEIYRVLKPGGQLVFMEDPVCLDIPFYRNWKKSNFALTERAMGINEHIYTIAEYYSFGEVFSKKEFYVDKELLKEYDKQQERRTGIKKIVGGAIRKYPSIFMRFMIWRFTSPLIFVFSK